MVEVEIAPGFVRVRSGGRSVRASGLGCEAALADPGDFGAELREAAGAVGAARERSAALRVADSRCVLQAFAIPQLPARLRREAALAQLHTLLPHGAADRFDIRLHWQGPQSVLAYGMPRDLIAALHRAARHWPNLIVEPASLPLVRATGLADGVFFAFSAGECTQWVVSGGRVLQVDVEGALAPSSLRVLVTAAHRAHPRLGIHSLDAPADAPLDGVEPWSRQVRPSAAPFAHFGPTPRVRRLLRRGVRLAVPVVLLAAAAGAPLQVVAWNRQQQGWSTQERVWQAGTAALQARERRSQQAARNLADLASLADAAAIPWAQGAAVIETTAGARIVLQSVTAAPEPPVRGSRSPQGAGRGFLWTARGSTGTTADLVAWGKRLAAAGWSGAAFGPVAVRQNRIYFTLRVAQPQPPSAGGPSGTAAPSPRVSLQRTAVQASRPGGGAT